MLLIKLIGEETDGAVRSNESDHQHGHSARPQWMRVIAMEIMRGCVFLSFYTTSRCSLFVNRLCSDAELIRNMWARYDAEQSGSKVFTSLITALKRLITEKPALLGVGSQMFGVGVSSHPGDIPASSSSNFDVGAVAGMVATAASATVSGVVGMMGSGGGLSLQGSAMKLQWCVDVLVVFLSPSFLTVSFPASISLTRPTHLPFRSHIYTSSGYNALSLSVKASRRSRDLYIALS